MRWTALAMLWFFGFVLAGQAQEPKKKDDKKDPPSEKEFVVHDIGGKSLDQWIDEISSKDPSKREAAMRTVLGFGPEKSQKALPALVAELKKHTLSSPIDISGRLSGMASISAILNSMKEPPPDKMLKDLAAIFRVMLKDDQALVRTRAVQLLPVIGPEAKSALPEVIATCAFPGTWEVRQAALQTLGVIGGDKNGPDFNVGLALNKALLDNSYLVRFAALQAVGKLGPPTNPNQNSTMLRTLNSLATDKKDRGIQIWAHMALMTLKKKVTTEHLTPIKNLLSDEDAMIRSQAAQAIGMLGEEGKPAIPMLCSLLKDTEPEDVIGSCLVALGSIKADTAVKAIQAFERDTKNEGLKLTAKLIINQILDRKAFPPEKKMEKDDKK